MGNLDDLTTTGQTKPDAKIYTGTSTHPEIHRPAGCPVIQFQATEKDPITMMKEATTITFQDAESSDEAIAIVRYDESNVALCLSLKSNGDIEVVMNKADAYKLIEALTTAVSQA